MIDEPDDDGFVANFHDPDHGWLIARAISAWARIEYEIDDLIWELAQVENDVGACLTSQYLNLASRVSAVVALAHLRKISEIQIKELNRFDTAASNLADKRNRLVHDPWVTGYKSKKLYRLEKTARKKLKHQYVEVSESELREFEKSANELEVKFGEIRSKILQEFWTLP